jgi:hypothetical protein
VVLVVVQRDWRIYNDATPDTSLSALAAEDTAPALVNRYINNGFIRIRVRLAETGGTAGTNLACTLQYSRDETTWQAIPAQDTSTGEHFLYADAMATAGGTVDTLLLTGSVTAGKYFENSTTTQSIAASATGLEIDFAVKLHWPTTGTWFFRVLYNAVEAALDVGYTHPQVTITAANRTHFVANVGGKPTAEGLTEETRMGDQKRAWFDGRRYWYFYTVNGDTTTLHYRHWEGAGEWSAASTITSTDATDQGRWRMWVENISGNHTVFLLLGNNQGAPATRYLRRGTITGSATIDWDSEQTISGDFGDEGNAIGVDDGDFVWVGGVTNGGGSIWVKRATSANSVSAFQAAKTLTDAGADETRPFYIVGLASDKALCIWYDTTDTDIHAAIVTDAGGFGAFTTVNSSAVAHDQDFGFTVDKANGFVYVAHTNSITNGAGDVLLRCFTIGSETWASCTTPPAGVGNRPFGGDDHLAVQLLNNGRLACYFTGQSNGEDRQVDYLIYSGNGTGGTWETNATHLSPPRLSNLDRITTVGPGTTPDRLLAFAASGDEPNVSSTVDIEWWDELIVDPHPVFSRFGVLQSATTTITVPWPAHQIGDIGLLIIETANGAVTLPTPAGFVEVPDSPQGTGTIDTTTATRVTCFWCRATSAAMASPVTDDPGNHVIGQILTFRRCVTSDNPWNVTAGGVDAAGSRTIAVPGDTTTLAKCLAVLIATNVTDLSVGQTNSWNNADLADFIFATHSQATSGNGGGFGVACGYREPSGAFGTTDGRLAGSSVQGFLTIALKPTFTRPFSVPLLRRRFPEESPTDEPWLSRPQPVLFQPPAAPPALSFTALRRQRQVEEDPVEESRFRQVPAVLFQPPPAAPAFQFSVLRRESAAPQEVPVEEPRFRPTLAFLFQPPPPAPQPWRIELLRHHRVVDPEPEPPVWPQLGAWFWPAPVPPAITPWQPYLSHQMAQVEQEIEPTAPTQSLAWMVFAPAQVKGKTTCGTWTNQVLFDPCEELRVTVAFPGADNVRIRMTLGFEAE